MMLTKEDVTSFFISLQENICAAIEQADRKSFFSKEEWTREEGGGGITRAITGGNVIEKGCVNFSGVSGKLPTFLYRELGFPENIACDFYASGVSIVMHPLSPMVPIIHMNVRYFEVVPPASSNLKNIKWFGGGIDLTPHYVNEEDAVFFHSSLKKVCDKFHPAYYDEFKKWADDYFFIKHRNETRGVGGVFFDKLMEKDEFSFQQRFDFIKAIGESFVPIYTRLLTKNQNIPFGENEKQWQYLRRGRYVEFNLVYDRGTRFGLETNGRVESILLSLPHQAQWIYDFHPAKNSPEQRTLTLLKKGVDWTK